MVLLFCNRHTGRLESLHNCCLGVCTKTISFSVRTYIYRTILNVDGRKLWEGSTAEQTKKWDVTPVLECKKYPHIPKLMNTIELEYKD